MTDIIAEKIAEAVRLQDEKKRIEDELARKKAEEQRIEKERLQGIKELWDNFTRDAIINALSRADLELGKIGGRLYHSYEVEDRSNKVIARYNFTVCPPPSFGPNEFNCYITLFKTGVVAFSRQHDPYNEKVERSIDSIDENAINEIFGGMLLSILRPR